jgi:hypothetical protein
MVSRRLADVFETGATRIRQVSTKRTKNLQSSPQARGTCEKSNDIERCGVDPIEPEATFIEAAKVDAPNATIRICDELNSGLAVSKSQARS